MKHLELEQILPYLPFALKWKYTGDDEDYGDILVMNNLSVNCKVSLLIDKKSFTIQNFDTINFEFLPILKPLSELDSDNEFWNEFYVEFGGGYNNLKAFRNSWGKEILLDPLSLGYKYWKLLLKYHYDVFYLLDHGLAFPKGDSL